jgi:hypothetical protein
VWGSVGGSCQVVAAPGHPATAPCDRVLLLLLLLLRAAAAAADHHPQPPRPAAATHVAGVRDNHAPTATPPHRHTATPAVRGRGRVRRVARKACRARQPRRRRCCCGVRPLACAATCAVACCCCCCCCCWCAGGGVVGEGHLLGQVPLCRACCCWWRAYRCCCVAAGAGARRKHAAQHLHATAPRQQRRPTALATCCWHCGNWQQRVHAGMQCCGGRGRTCGSAPHPTYDHTGDTHTRGAWCITSRACRPLSCRC